MQAICDWVHNNREYRYGSGRPDLSASEAIEQRYGVCRDFAHVVVALCRTFNLPARYVSGHLPDIGFVVSSHPEDFHAYCEVYLGGRWFTFDARFNAPRTGRIKLSHGLDAVDGAFATIYGEARLSYFEVWTYQVNPKEVGMILSICPNGSMGLQIFVSDPAYRPREQRNAVCCSRLPTSLDDGSACSYFLFPEAGTDGATGFFWPLTFFALC